MAAAQNVMEAEAEKPVAPVAPTVDLGQVNLPPAQTWNRLRANGIDLTVPQLSRKGDVYFALPRLFDRVECGMGQAVTDWVTSQAADSTYVEVKAHTRRTEPIVVAIDADAGQVADAGVMVRTGAEATIVVAVRGGAEAATTSGALVRVIAEAGSHVRLVEVVGVGERQQHLESVGIDADDDAVVEVSQYLLGGGTVADGLAVNLAGDRARLDLTTHYYAGGHDRLDINHVARQRGHSTRAQIRESGVLDGAAEKSLRATIDLVHGSDGSVGNEAETVLVTGDDVVNKTMPVILCDEENVQGNHGATIGSASPEQLDYLCDRGLSRREAEELFVRAIFEHAIINAPTAEAHAVAVAQAERVLGTEVAHDFDDAAALVDGEASLDTEASLDPSCPEEE